jgi:hypothetical protein
MTELRISVPRGVYVDIVTHVDPGTPSEDTVYDRVRICDSSSGVHVVRREREDRRFWPRRNSMDSPGVYGEPVDPRRHEKRAAAAIARAREVEHERLATTRAKEDHSVHPRARCLFKEAGVQCERESSGAITSEREYGCSAERSKYCGRHERVVATLSRVQVTSMEAVPRLRCEAITKAGTQCSRYCEVCFGVQKTRCAQHR